MTLTRRADCLSLSFFAPILEIFCASEERLFSKEAAEVSP